MWVKKYWLWKKFWKKVSRKKYFETKLQSKREFGPNLKLVTMYCWSKQIFRGEDGPKKL